MQQKFYELTTKLAEEANTFCSCQPQDRVTAIQLQDFSIHFMLDEESQNAIMQAVVGLVPAHKKDLFYEKLLQWNNKLLHAKGFSFALFDSEELVTFQALISLRDLDMDYAKKVFIHFVSALIVVLEQVEEFTNELALMP